MGVAHGECDATGRRGCDGVSRVLTGGVLAQHLSKGNVADQRLAGEERGEQDMRAPTDGGLILIARLRILVNLLLSQSHRGAAFFLTGGGEEP